MVVEVELLVIADCSREGPAAQLLRAALDDVGLTGTPFTTTVIATREQAQSRGFIGSPTIAVNGADLFPVPGRPAGLACRIYAHPEASTGLPGLRELRQALKRAADPLRSPQH